MKKWIFLGLWLLCLVAFSAGQLLVLPDYHLIPNNPWRKLFGTSVLSGIVFFLLMLFSFLSDRKNGKKLVKATVLSKKKINKSTRRKLKIFFIISGVFVAILFTEPVQVFTKKTQLMNFYTKLTNYEKSSDYEAIYELLSPDYKRKTSLRDFLAERNKNKAPYSTDFQAYSYKVDGDRGIIDRTIITCDTPDCTGSSRHESRAYKEYIYLNGKWYVPEANTAWCIRKEPYEMAPEFERAISLIIQRLGNGNTYLDENILDVKSCLNISYSTEVDKYEADGLFSFDEDSTKDNLKISVSPRYVANDDIVTAILLAHEITHALQYSMETNISCYEMEAAAFANQIIFVTALNKAEKDSIVSRNVVGDSSEIHNLFDLITQSNQLTARGMDFYESMLSIVKSNPYYQKQCASY